MNFTLNYLFINKHKIWGKCCQKNKILGVKFIKKSKSWVQYLPKKNWDKKCNYVKSKITESKVFKFLKLEIKTHQINLLGVKNLSKMKNLEVKSAIKSKFYKYNLYILKP